MRPTALPRADHEDVRCDDDRCDHQPDREPGCDPSHSINPRRTDRPANMHASRISATVRIVRTRIYLHLDCGAYQMDGEDVDALDTVTRQPSRPPDRADNTLATQCSPADLINFVSTMPKVWSRLHEVPTPRRGVLAVWSRPNNGSGGSTA